MATNTRRMKDNAAKPTIANLRLVSSSAAKTKKKKTIKYGIGIRKEDKRTEQRTHVAPCLILGAGFSKIKRVLVSSLLLRKFNYFATVLSNFQCKEARNFFSII